MLRFELPVTHRPDREGTVASSSHVPFYLALEITSQAWAAALAATCAGVLEPTELAVVNVTSDYRRELFVGEVSFDVTLKSFGVSSLTFGIELSQFGHSAATVSTTLVRVDANREHSVPFSTAQRDGLEELRQL
jgi:acyl-CoA thioesterase FadM